MYEVIKSFIDLKDKDHEYNVGDEYPRKGYEPAKKRIEELAGENNKQGVPLIKKVEEEKAPAKKGGKAEKAPAKK